MPSLGSELLFLPPEIFFRLARSIFGAEKNCSKIELHRLVTDLPIFGVIDRSEASSRGKWAWIIVLAVIAVPALPQLAHTGLLVLGKGQWRRPVPRRIHPNEARHQWSLRLLTHHQSSLLACRP